MNEPLTVEEIWRFPVKSMQGEALTEAEVDERGVRGDRQWGVHDVSSGTILTGRRCPELLFVAARYHASTDEVEIVLPSGHRQLSAFLGREVELVRAGTKGPGRFEIATDFEHEDSSPWVSWQGPAGTYHDSARTPVSLLTRGSMGTWDTRRFRANLVAAGSGEMELVGRTLRFGTVEATTPQLIDRCVMVTRAQPGVDRDLEVLRTINRTTAGNLGLSLLVNRSGSVRVGDPVELLAG